MFHTSLYVLPSNDNAHQRRNAFEKYIINLLIYSNDPKLSPDH